MSSSKVDKFINQIMEETKSTRKCSLKKCENVLIRFIFALPYIFIRQKQNDVKKSDTQLSWYLTLIFY